MKELLEKLSKGETTVEEVLKAIDDNQKDYVPRSRLNDKNDEIKDLKDELKNRDTQITDLQKAVKGNEDLENKLKDLEKANGDWETKYKAAQIDAAIKLAAKDAKDPADVLAFVDKSKLQLNEDGSIVGLDDALKTLRESKAYLFGDSEPAGLRGRQPHPPGNTPPSMTKDQFNQLGYSDRVKLYNENPDLYKQLSN
jgi:DNA repair exonuclease SbcCD ATPase subunit